MGINVPNTQDNSDFIGSTSSTDPIEPREVKITDEMMTAFMNRGHRYGYFVAGALHLCKQVRLDLEIDVVEQAGFAVDDATIFHFSVGDATFPFAIDKTAIELGDTDGLLEIGKHIGELIAWVAKLPR